jgi:hypothetical protein
MAPPSQELEPPANPGRFTSFMCRLLGIYHRDMSQLAHVNDILNTLISGAWNFDANGPVEYLLSFSLQSSRSK